MTIDSLFALILAHKWIAVAAVIVGAIVRLMKGDTPLPFVSPRLRPWLSIVLGLLAAALDKMISGGSLGAALIDGVVIGVLPIVGHELGIESVRGGKEIPMPKVPVSLLPFLFLLVGCTALRDANDARVWLCDHIGEEHAADIRAQAAQAGITPDQLLEIWRASCIFRLKQAEAVSVAAIGQVHP